MPNVIACRAREILDSRGFPTIEVDVRLESGAFGRAAVPSGASTGQYEALELRDRDPKRYSGRGVLQAIAHVREEIAPRLQEHPWESLSQLDAALCEWDGTHNKSRLGANATLAVSIAMAKALAQAANQSLATYLSGGNTMSLPVPLFNVINGGAHADNGLDVQEIMLIPYGLNDYPAALQAGAEIFQTLKVLLKNRGLSTATGDEGGFAPELVDVPEALDLIMEAILQAGYVPGEQVGIGLDVAASEFWQGGGYALEKGEKYYNSAAWVEVLTRWVDAYPIISIEDGMAEHDWPGWALLTQAVGSRVQLVGDDVFVTNVELLRRGIENHIGNAILIKPNQIGTLSETLEAIAVAKEAGYAVIASHRSGETEDTTIADLAVGLSMSQIKAGSLCRSERLAKYNALLRLSEEQALSYWGKDAFARFLCGK